MLRFRYNKSGKYGAIFLRLVIFYFISRTPPGEINDNTPVKSSVFKRSITKSGVLKFGHRHRLSIKFQIKLAKYPFYFFRILFLQLMIILLTNETNDVSVTGSRFCPCDGCRADCHFRSQCPWAQPGRPLPPAAPLIIADAIVKRSYEQVPKRRAAAWSKKNALLCNQVTSLLVVLTLTV